MIYRYKHSLLPNLNTSLATWACENHTEEYDKFERTTINLISDFVDKNSISTKIYQNLRLIEICFNPSIMAMISEDSIAKELNGSVSIEIQNNKSITFISLGESSLSYYTQTGESISNKKDLRSLCDSKIHLQICTLNEYLVKEYLGEFKHKLSRALEFSSKRKRSNMLVYCE